MRILITGASGFLGTALRVRFAEQGYEVRRLVRRTPVSSTSEFHWDPAQGRINADAVTDVDVIINLAGPPVFTRPWTDSRRQLLRDARIEATRLLAETVVERYAGSSTKPLWLQSSATGWYGTRSGPEPYDETAPAAGDFLGRLAHDWEAATEQAASAGVPVIKIRNGMVLDHSGSTLKLIKPVFKLGLGASLGDGHQRMTIISLHDWLRAVQFMIDKHPPAGPYNLTIPQPPTNAVFTATLARLLGSKARLTAPGKVLRTALGELAEQLVGDQYVVPTAITEQGFRFDGPDVKQTVQLALG
ncbi:TIGR01777 family protein [Microlunatus elymi]|uniref:TIGR01777 family protein n=1 Tax=Microlunatus elymi TaxID=2596828 RepID=A0A516Q2M5_9ACTN|nr:TIGR01777 family oxidoreductase [Microlunatus elymi]QDP97684.1 TIGR01777 family protein [Microlunatus elymi]